MSQIKIHHPLTPPCKRRGDKTLPLLLLILDGWGIAKPNRGNAVTLARTPNLNKLFKNYPYTELCAHGECVGLPIGQVGNSEAGHMNIGAGRIVEQDEVRINESIEDGTFFKNTALNEAMKYVLKNKSKLHLMGIISSQSSPHGDPKHLRALVNLARHHKISEVYLHLFTDGRDSPPYSALKFITALERDVLSHEKIATIMGRYYAMDRKKKWENTARAYNALVDGQARTAKSPQAAITEGYNRRESDEFLEPYIITNSHGDPLPRVSNNDSLIFFNLRSDRARQLAKPFVQVDFEKKNNPVFTREKILKNLKFVAMTDFGPDLDSILTAFSSVDLKSTLPMELSHLKQLYIAETEKYAHVTYFFNGGYADPVNGEKRMVVPSPDVKSYDETPEMSSKKLTQIILKNVAAHAYDFTVLNFAAPDMIGHTGNLKAAIQTCEAMDKYVNEIVRAYLAKNGTIIITADHGNIEEMLNLKTGEANTEHSTNPVPFVIINKYLKNKIKLRKGGKLGDVAPTILDLLGIKKPKEMAGRTLII
jgi:2,3-bisphosphoglycerate-independent phosphoglycerate mutase